MLKERLEGLVRQGWKDVFDRSESLLRACEHLMATASITGRHTISNTICALGRKRQDWSADYKLFSRSRWEENKLFQPVLEHCLQRYRKGPIGIALDDTKIAKTGKRIPNAGWHRDPLSPPFHVNFLYGLRFLQASVIYPHHKEQDVGARAIPVRFSEAPPIKKPGKKATEAEWCEYRKMKKKNNLSLAGVVMIEGLRCQLDQSQAKDRKLIVAMDGSFCNKTLFSHRFDRVTLLARARKDARLCRPAPDGSRRKYDLNTFTPEAIRQDESAPYKSTDVFYGGRFRQLRYKQLYDVLWRRGAGLKHLRLIVIAPQPYKPTKNSRFRYRDPAYLLSTDASSSVGDLIQLYLDRWQIEVNLRDEKSIMGVGHAQLTSPLAVPRHPAFTVASYSMILLAGLIEFGPTRTSHYPALPKWRKKSCRPSILDLLNLLREEINETHLSSTKLEQIDTNPPPNNHEMLN
jgi:hypothetical protein